MKRKIVITAALALLGLAASPAAPPSALSSAPLTTAQAAVTKSLNAGAGGGNVSAAGNRFGDLLSGWAVPVLIAFAGCLLIGALASRNVGASLGIVLITVVGLIFLLSPQSIEGLAKGIANVVF